MPSRTLSLAISRETSREEAYFAHVDSLLRPRYTKLANGNYESLAPLELPKPPEVRSQYFFFCDGKELID
jgi:hypothetical protein